MVADYSFYVKSIAACALLFFGYIISFLASVRSLTCAPLDRAMQLRDAIMTNHPFRIICLPIIELCQIKKFDQTQSPILAYSIWLPYCFYLAQLNIFVVLLKYTQVQ